MQHCFFCYEIPSVLKQVKFHWGNQTSSIQDVCSTCYKLWEDCERFMNPDFVGGFKPSAMSYKPFQAQDKLFEYHWNWQRGASADNKRKTYDDRPEDQLSVPQNDFDWNLKPMTPEFVCFPEESAWPTELTPPRCVKFTNGDDGIPDVIEPWEDMLFDHPVQNSHLDTPWYSPLLVDSPSFDATIYNNNNNQGGFNEHGSFM